MDKKKKIIISLLAFALLLLSASLRGQDITTIQFVDKHFEYEAGRDSISLFFNLLNKESNRQKNLSVPELAKYLVVTENGVIIPGKNCVFAPVGSGKRIPSDFTFSVLVDLSIPENGKMQIYKSLETLVSSAPDSCVYLSFFGERVGSTELLTKSNLVLFRQAFLSPPSRVKKCLYSAMFSKISEFELVPSVYESMVRQQPGYMRNGAVAERGFKRPDRNILMVFAEGSQYPQIEDFGLTDFVEYQRDLNNEAIPAVYAFYYIEKGNEFNTQSLLKAMCENRFRPDRSGRFMPANNMDTVLSDFEKIVNDKSYDYELKYKVDENRTYAGNVEYKAEWKADALDGVGVFSIGSPERPWPERVESAGDSFLRYIVALLVSILIFALFLFVTKVFVPWIRSRSFERKYYKVYVPEENVRKRVCHYCGQEILPGQRIVIKCKHIMHVDCWKQNDYRCSEYGQNCKEGIQPHVHWKQLFTKASLRESIQTLSGIGAAFVAWLVYELAGRGGFKGIAEWIVGFSLKAGMPAGVVADCIEKTSALLMIGLLLGFFLTLVFRFNDEYRTKNFRIIIKILGLSILSGLLGMLAFGLGAVLLCALVSAAGTTFIPWYCSLPAYVLFSLSVAALLTWKSSVPIKSALLGGGIASVIGFIVLFFFSATRGWMNILLNFIIYGGGIGASLVTVRMLSERYFLIIQNGIRAGQKIPIHKWMNATGGGNKVSIGMTGECEIQMNWEKSNKVAKEHARLYIDPEKKLPIVKPMATGVQFNSRVELAVGKPYVLSNGDTFKIGDTIFKYVESE